VLKEPKSPSYYSSPLNEFIDLFCSHEMDCINIDCLLLKVSKKRIRLVEFKRENERLPKSEIRVFKILNYVLNHQKEWNIEIFVVRGNPPFDSVLVETIPEGINAWHLTKSNLIEWLNFERELEAGGSGREHTT